jgi:hypothetical protein
VHGFPKEIRFGSLRILVFSFKVDRGMLFSFDKFLKADDMLSSESPRWEMIRT